MILPFARVPRLCVYVFPRTRISVKPVESSASVERSRKLYLPWVLGFLLARVLFSAPHCGILSDHFISLHRPLNFMRRIFEGYLCSHAGPLAIWRRWQSGQPQPDTCREAESFSLVEITSACRFPTAILVDCAT